MQSSKYGHCSWGVLGEKKPLKLVTFFLFHILSGHSPWCVILVKLIIWNPKSLLDNGLCLTPFFLCDCLCIADVPIEMPVYLFRLAPSQPADDS